ncbi:uncharacterized protein LOC117185805 [Drosophila miranda]|uniref:uncharacterized protein LOC117185805 n=1 Tax=Drosophila miranda TaxID=7229 RepID=UPI0007E6C650|nr:uncharacterized protein LOC117185805 [Drosophila miranda]
MAEPGKKLPNSRGPCPIEFTESQISYGPPKINKALTTRANRIEQFLWQELFDEYNRQASATADLGVSTTEYFDVYCKDIPPVDEERKETLVNKYPVYCTTAITLWNHDGDPTKTFKKKYLITRPIQECTEKFAP